MSRVLEKDNSSTTKVSKCTVADLLLGFGAFIRYTLKAIGVCLEEIVDVVFHEASIYQALQLVDCGLNSGVRRLRLYAAYIVSPTFAFVDSVLLFVLDVVLKTFVNFDSEVKSFEKLLRVVGLSGTTHPFGLGSNPHPFGLGCTTHPLFPC